MRLAADPAFSVGLDDLQAATDARRYVGRAPEQVDEFLAEVVEPILAGHADVVTEREELRV